LNNNVKAGHKEKQSYANTRTSGKEQYYTRQDVVDLCISEVQKHVDLTGRTILEPCGGTGEFLKGFQRVGIPGSNILSCDIQPFHPAITEANYLTDDPVLGGMPISKHTGLISITNPPFGRASSLAKKFFNTAAQNHDYICYLVPRAWLKWSIINSLDENFHLISSIDLPQNCFYLPDSEEPKKKDVLNTVFQIWERRETKRKRIQIPDHGLIQKIIPTMKKVKAYKKTKRLLYEKSGEDFVEVEVEYYTKEVVSRPDYVTGANFQMVVFGNSCGQCTEINTPRADAKTTTMYLKIDRQDVKDALKKIDYSKYYNNVSYVRALSIQEINYELNEYFGLENFKFKEVT